MPAALTLKDRVAANVTFNGFSESSDANEWVEAGAPSLLSTSRLRVARKMPANKANGILRTTARLTRPVVNGTTLALDGTMTVNIEILRPANLGDVHVEEIMARASALCGLASIWNTAKSGMLPA